MARMDCRLSWLIVGGAVLALPAAGCKGEEIDVEEQDIDTIDDEEDDDPGDDDDDEDDDDDDDEDPCAYELSDDPGYEELSGTPAWAIQAEDQVLEDFTTLVTIDQVEVEDPAVIVIQLDNNQGEPQSWARGTRAVQPGVYAAVEVGLNWTVSDGQLLHATLYHDEGGEFDVGDANPVLDGGGDPITDTFEVTVSDEAIYAELAFIPTDEDDGFELAAVRPDSLYDRHYLGDGPLNPSLMLDLGQRYRVLNKAYPCHRFELVDKGENPEDDVVFLSQAVEGQLHDEEFIEWVDDGKEVSFSVFGPEMYQQLSGYRCADHPEDMRGEMMVLD